MEKEEHMAAIKELNIVNKEVEKRENAEKEYKAKLLAQERDHRSKIEACETQVLKMANAAKAQEAKILARDQDCDTLQKKIESLEKAKEELEICTKKVQQNLDIEKLQHAVQGEEKKVLEEEVFQLKEERKKAKLKLSRKLTTELKECRTKLEKTENAFSVLNNELESVKAERASSKEMLSKEQEKVATLSTQVEQHNHQIEALEGEIKKNEEFVSAGMKENEELKEKYNILKSKIVKVQKILGEI